MVHAFSQLIHNKSHEITHLVTHLVWPHWQKLQPERPRAWRISPSRSPSWWMVFLSYYFSISSFVWLSHSNI